MVDRRERVILDVDGNFVGEMTKAAAAAAALNQQLGILDRSGRLPGLQQTTQRDLPALGRQARQTGNDIDRLSGRLGLLAKAAGALGPALVPITTGLVPGLAALTTGLGFTVVGAGAVVVAFQGVGDALEAVNKAALEPTVENIAAAEEALNRLAPAAQAAVLRMRDLGPALREIRDAAAGGFFPGFIAGLDSFEQMAPRVARFFETIGDVTGDLFAAGAADLASGRWAKIADYLESEARPAMMAWGGAIGDVTHGLGELWVALDPLTDFGTRGFADMAASFDDWAMGLSKTEGFQEFVAYVQETGPQVLDTLGAFGDAILQIGEAASPLGGPVLKILEVFADTIAKIADSPLGTPIMAYIGALSALRLSAAATTGTLKLLNTEMAKQSAIAGGGGMAVGGRGFVADYRTSRNLQGPMTLQQLQAQQAAAARVGQVTRNAAGGVAALGVAATSASTGTFGMYSALGLTVGMLGGPWGAAIGGGIGMLADWAVEADRATVATSDYEQALAAAVATGDRAALVGLRDVASDAGAAVKETKPEGDLGRGLDYLKGEAVAGSIAEIDSALDGLAQAQGFASNAAMEHYQSLRALAGQTLEAMNVELAYEQALLRANEAAKDGAGAFKRNGDLVHNATEDQLSAAQALFNSAAAWGELTAAQRRARGGTRAAKADFIETATALGMSKEAARDLARELLNIPAVKPDVDVDIRAAKKGIDEALRYVKRFTGKTVPLDADPSGVYAAVEAAKAAIQGFSGASVNLNPFAADGATVPKTGLPYADRHLYLLADGEEVISNRFGQADRHRGLLKQINANRLADGGTASREQVASYAARSDAGGHSGRGMQPTQLRVTGRLDTPWGPADIEGIARDVARTEINDDRAWVRRQEQSA